MPGSDRLLELLAQRPMTSRELQRALSAPKSTVDDWLAKARAAGHAHVAERFRTSGHRYCARYACGPGPDAAPPPPTRPLKASDWGASTDLVLLALSELGEATQARLRTHTGLDKGTISCVLARLTRVSLRGPHKGQRRAFVSRWVGLPGQKRQPAYSVGNQPNVPRPEALRGYAKTRAYRQRQKPQPLAPRMSMMVAWLVHGE